MSPGRCDMRGVSKKLAVMVVSMVTFSFMLPPLELSDLMEGQTEEIMAIEEVDEVVWYDDEVEEGDDIEWEVVDMGEDDWEVIWEAVERYEGEDDWEVVWEAVEHDGSEGDREVVLVEVEGAEVVEWVDEDEVEWDP